MNYTMTPRLTKFDSVNFRSRLEAKWAWMFNRLEWAWQYEPCEINGYNPDFIIYTEKMYGGINTIIVEVKPRVMIDEKYKNDLSRKYSNIKSHILLLDEAPFFDYNGYLCIGYGAQCFVDDLGNIKHTEITEMQMKSINDFSSELFAWDGMVKNKIDRKSFLDCDSEEANYLKNLWKESGNRLQFKV